MKKRTVSEGIAILALLLNILVIPGLGSIIGRREYEGVWQLALYFVGWAIFGIGMILTITIVGALVGVPLWILGGLMLLWSWIWSLITGIEIIRYSS